MSDARQHVRYRFGFDIGGTFTDLVLSGSDGSVFAGKVLSDTGMGSSSGLANGINWAVSKNAKVIVRRI